MRDGQTLTLSRRGQVGLLTHQLVPYPPGHHPTFAQSSCHTLTHCPGARVTSRNIHKALFGFFEKLLFPPLPLSSSFYRTLVNMASDICHRLLLKRHVTLAKEATCVFHSFHFLASLVCCCSPFFLLTLSWDNHKTAFFSGFCSRLFPTE